MAVSFKNENRFNFLSHLMISFMFYRRPPPLKSVTMATRNALFPIFNFQKFTNAYVGKVTKFQFNCFSHLGAAFQKPEGAASTPPPPPSLIRVNTQFYINAFRKKAYPYQTQKKSGNIFPRRRGRKLRKSSLDLTVLMRLDSSPCPTRSKGSIK